MQWSIVFLVGLLVGACGNDPVGDGDFMAFFGQGTRVHRRVP